MKIDINENAKVVALWFGNQENVQEKLPTDIQRKIEDYKKNKYKICIYQSGNEDLKSNLLNLILNNVKNI